MWWSSRYSKMFGGVPNNFMICMSEANTKYKIYSQINQLKFKVIDCTINWGSKQQKIIGTNGDCKSSCVSDNTYKYDYNEKCFEKCLKSSYENFQWYCELDKCQFYNQASLSLDLCTTCNTNYYKKENDNLNLGKYINCYKNPIGYYLDESTSLFKKCYKSCETCEVNGNDIAYNFSKCDTDFPVENKINNNNNMNCYHRCDFYYYFDYNND